MTRQVIEIEINGYSSLVKGYGSRSILMDLTGRAQVWSSLRRGWAVQESTARNVLAAVESMPWFDVVITGPRAAAAAVQSVSTATELSNALGSSVPVEETETQDVLW